jgi:hypothetical protein
LSAVITKAQGAGLNYVTAIVNSELEAEVAQLLFSHGNNIIFRALNLNTLSDFLAQEENEFQIIHCADFATDSAVGDLKGKFAQIKFTQIATGFDPAILLSNLSQSMRQPLLRKQQRLPNLISVLGTFGSPGISTVTNQLAARKPSSTILHATPKTFRPVINHDCSELQIENLDFNVPTTGNCFLDAGSTTGLTGSISDRRFAGQILNWALNSSAKLIYVLKPDENGIAGLSTFLNDYQNLITPPPIIYILNQQRFNAKARLINTQFLSLVSGQIQFQIPFDFAAVQKYPTGKQWLTSTFSKQFDLISKSLA